MKTLKEKSYWRNSIFFNNFFINQVQKNRRKFLRTFRKYIDYNKNSVVLDVGATPSLDSHENFFVQKYPFKKNITCLSNFNCEILKSKFSEINLALEDARNMNLKSNKYDIVHSNATIEHVGSFDDQLKFLQECIRVSNKYIFITTPNRFFPIELHTKLPFLHFLPKTIFRKILILFNDHFFSKEENLNLLSLNDVKKLLKKSNVKNFKIYKNKVCYLVSNFIIIITK